MNKERFAGMWKQLKGGIKQQWGKLTDDEIDRMEGSWERLVGMLQERYGIERAEAEKQLEEFLEQTKQEPTPA
jgi:uncharacterized protein YjbJ (UPF0337 family)